MNNKLLLGLVIAVTGCVASDADGVDLSWTDTEATIQHDGMATTFARTDELGRWNVVLPQVEASQRILELVENEQRRAQSDGVRIPWDEADPMGSALASCTTRRTWVMGSDCAACWDYVEARMVGDLRSQSCSEGVIYTTCSSTKCL